ncbi:hypothetical protein Agabi119p4_8545 [Agaricus bisporus var. burnettii]|uniref:Uncharacterized protein n=1 Tax=Agaricus bisporus var. burnettii TaxID=192524 RepID=A0A8H7EYJ2_AGABI|nr:hypothetical protein Agabi119p4_8545 [Agaricus bisporus var. burnettii]
MERLTTEMVDLGHVAVSVCQEESRNHGTILVLHPGEVQREEPRFSRYQIRRRSIHSEVSRRRKYLQRHLGLKESASNFIPRTPYSLKEISGHHQSNLRTKPEAFFTIPSLPPEGAQSNGCRASCSFLTPQLHRELEGNLSNPSENNDEVTFAHLIRRPLRRDEK